MKHCKKCNTIKKISEFGKNTTKKDGLQSLCKVCSNLYLKNYYQNNKQYYVDKAKESNKKFKKQNYLYIFDYFNNNPCVDCGESDPVVLDFDHVRGEKIMNVSRMAASHSIENIKKRN